MKLNDERDELNKGKNMIIAAVCCFAAILFVVVLVIMLNYESLGINTEKKTEASVSSVSTVEISSIKADDPYSGLRTDDLSFFKGLGSENDDSPASENEEPETESVPDEATDGKHTLITYSDGTSEWVAISPYLGKNTYDFINLYNSNGKMKYYVDDKCVSYFGVDISKDQGYVDFNKLKKAGVDFVMIRAGARGYQTGQITMDDYFTDNLKRASDAGLEIGVYFMSQAVTETEAKEEAETVISYLEGYSVKYPVAFMMKYAENDNARVEGLSKNEKTKIAKAFCNYIQDAGYTPAIFGTKAWLIKYLDLSKLSDFDVWLSETGIDSPDYPYKFTMWQYSDCGTVDGIAGDVDLNISFINYSLK